MSPSLNTRNVSEGYATFRRPNLSECLICKDNTRGAVGYLAAIELADRPLNRRVTRVGCVERRIINSPLSSLR